LAKISLIALDQSRFFARPEKWHFPLSSFIALSTVSALYRTVRHCGHYYTFNILLCIQSIRHGRHDGSAAVGTSIQTLLLLCIIHLYATTARLGALVALWNQITGP